MKDRRKRTPRITRLEMFLQSRRLKPAEVAREAGYCRQHMLRLRRGMTEPTRTCIAAIVAACRRMSQEPVSATDLFELEDER